jgi:hypothetical protein
MARIELSPAALHVRLGRLERLGAFHDDVTVPVADLVGATSVPDVWTHLRGVRAPGTGIPGIIMLGTTRTDGLKDFCAVYRHGPGLVVELRDHEFARLLLTQEVGDAARLAAAIDDLVAGRA